MEAVRDRLFNDNARMEQEIEELADKTTQNAQEVGVLRSRLDQTENSHKRLVGYYSSKY